MSVKHIRISHVDISQHVSANQEDCKYKLNVGATNDTVTVKQEPNIVAVALEIQTLRQELGLPASAAMARILAS